MLTHAITAILLAATTAAQQTPTVQPANEQIGVWDVRVQTDPVTDAISMGAYLGTPRDNVALICQQDRPGFAMLVWRSTTPFEQGRFIPRTADELGAYGARVGYTTYRLDQDEAVRVPTHIDRSFRSDFYQNDIQPFTHRMATSTRLVLRDDLNHAHTVVFELNPADTLRMLQRLDAVCGTRFSAPPAEPADEDAEASPPAKGG